MAAIAPGPLVTDGQYTALITVASAAVTTSGQTGTSTAGAAIGDCVELAVGVNVTANSGSGAITPHIDTLGLDGVWYTIWTGTQITGGSGTDIASIGKACATNVNLGAQIRLGWTITGTSVTFSASVMGR